MEKILKLGNHTETELTNALLDFFGKKNMSATHIAKSKNHHIINAISKNISFSDRIFGDEMKCYVELKSDDHGNIDIVAGKGSWSGKLSGAALIIGGAILLGTGGIAGVILVADGLIVAGNVAEQASLPNQVCSYAEKFLVSTI